MIAGCDDRLLDQWSFQSGFANDTCGPHRSPHSPLQDLRVISPCLSLTGIARLINSATATWPCFPNNLKPEVTSPRAHAWPTRASHLAYAFVAHHCICIVGFHCHLRDRPLRLGMVAAYLLGYRLPLDGVSEDADIAHHRFTSSEKRTVL